MRTLAVTGFFLAVLAAVGTLLWPDRSTLLIATTAAVSLVLIGVRAHLAQATYPGVEDSNPDEVGESLQRWLSRTQSQINWSQTTRSDWDRHLRPMLARQFEIATNQRRTKDPAAYRATGEMLFGAELWPWVDPDNVQRSRSRQPGPGRPALEQILQCLERV